LTHEYGTGFVSIEAKRDPSQDFGEFVGHGRLRVTDRFVDHRVCASRFVKIPCGENRTGELPF
jgi:hypothetical protein